MDSRAFGPPYSTATPSLSKKNTVIWINLKRSWITDDPLN
jgi:hypothetical protein